MKPQYKQQGFTLVEILVVISIIGLLLALLLPAVQSSLRASDREVCNNKLRQMAIAVRGGKVLGERYPGYHEKVGDRMVPWPVKILTGLDQQSLYDSWRDNATGTRPMPFVGSFVCPSDTAKPVTGPSLSYVANAGRYLGVNGAGTLGAQDEKPENGIFHDYYNTRIKTTATDFTDGESNTLLLSENLLATQWTRTGKIDTVFVWHPTTTPTPEQLINGTPSTSAITFNTARPSSNHAGGVNVAFADGSTGFVAEEIDYVVYQALMTPHTAKSDMPNPGYQLQDSDYRP